MTKNKYQSDPIILPFIVVRISKKRWAVAQRQHNYATSYSLITKPIQTIWQAEMVKSEIEEIEEREYSQFTKDVLFDTHEELI